MKPEPLCYDNGGATLDRYTVFPRGRGWGPVWNPARRQRVRMFLGLSSAPSHPFGFSQWGEDTPGRHLGRRIAWANLPEHIRQHATARIAE